jgi:hypothetical protein
MIATSLGTTIMPLTTAKICLRRNGFDDANNADGVSPRAHQREPAQTDSGFARSVWSMTRCAGALQHAIARGAATQVSPQQPPWTGLSNPHGASASSSRDSPPRTGNRMQYGTKTRDLTGAALSDMRFYLEQAEAERAALG